EGVVGGGDTEVLGGEVGKVLQRGVRLVQQGEDQGPGENAAGELAAALAETGVLCQLVGGVVEEVVQGGMQFRYTDDHGRLRGTGGLWQIHPIPDLPFRSFHQPSSPCVSTPHSKSNLPPASPPVARIPPIPGG